MKLNKIKRVDVAKEANISVRRFDHFLGLDGDISIEELKSIKIYLVDKGIIKDNYDYADFLDLVKDE